MCVCVCVCVCVYIYIYTHICVVKVITVNNSMQIVEEFNLNYPYATLAECFVSRLGFKIFILLLVIKFYYRFFFLTDYCLSFFVELIYMHSALVKGP